MSKVLKDAALVIGVAAIVVATAGSGALGAGALASATSAAASVSAAVGATVSVSALAAGLAGAAAIASFASGALAKRPSQTVNPMTWQSDPQAGIPIVIGRAYTGGKIVYRQTFDKDNINQTINTVFSIGPVKAFEQLYIDGVATSVTSAGQANITDFGKMYIGWQMGAQPEAKQLGGTNNPGITGASKLSGLAADTTTLTYDTKGGHTMTTEPQKGWVIQGVRVYDPRKDDTYPGGSGPQRSTDETTWSYAGYDNPYLAALAWLIGWRQNGKLIAGVGVTVSAILLGQFVEGANVADANGWKCGGVLDSTDSKWQRLKDILLAGGAEPVRLGAQIGCLINTPRVSLATIGIGDVVGDASVQATQSMRDRINAVVPRFMGEQSITTQNSDGTLRTAVTWGMVPAGPVVVDDYVAFDGRQRQKQIDFELVQGVANGANAPNQVAQLARYAIENAREFGPITLPLKLRWMGYKPGDVVTAYLPELGLLNQDILILNRSLEADKGTVTMTARSETAAKHAFALGQTTSAPATPSVSGPAVVSAPTADEWTLTGGTLTGNGQTVPALFVTGGTDAAIDGIIFELRVYTGSDGDNDNWISEGSGDPSTTSKTIVSVVQEAEYQVSIRYRRGSGGSNRLILGPVTVGQDSATQEAAAALAAANAIASDGYISAGQEKRDLVRIVTDIQNEKPVEDGRAALFGVSATAYDNAYTALINYLSSLTPAWNDVDQTTPVDGGKLNTALNGYESAHVALVDAMAKTAAQSAAGVNRLKYSRFEHVYSGWNFFQLSTGPTYSTFILDANQSRYLGWDINFTAAGQIAVLASNKYTCSAGDRLCCQTFMEAYGQAMNAGSPGHYISCQFFDVNGNVLREENTGLIAGGVLDSLIYFFTNPAPAGTVTANFFSVAVSGQAGSCHHTIHNPMVCSVPIGQTTVPPFVAGPNSDDGADVTGQNVAVGFQGQGALAVKNQANTADIVPGGVSATHAVTWGDGFQVGEGDVVTTDNISVSVSGDGQSGVLAFCQFNPVRGTGRATGLTVILLRDGIQVGTTRVGASTSAYGIQQVFFVIDSPGPGTHNYQLKFMVDDTGTGTGAPWTINANQGAFLEFRR